MSESGVDEVREGEYDAFPMELVLIQHNSADLEHNFSESSTTSWEEFFNSLDEHEHTEPLAEDVSPSLGPSEISDSNIDLDITTNDVPMPSEPPSSPYYLPRLPEPPSSSPPTGSPSPTTNPAIEDDNTRCGRKRKLSVDESLIVEGERVRRKSARALGVAY